MRIREIALTSTALSLLATLGAAAQTAEERIAQLEARVATLEDSQGSLSFNNGRTAVDFYGYVKADFIYDFGYELGDTTFGLVSLNDDSETGDFFTATARQTRLGFTTTTPTQMGDLGTTVEIDFYGADGFEPRIRIAKASLGGFQVGQDWSLFVPLGSYPGTLDFQGFAGIPFARQEQLRYSYEFGGNYVAEVSLEESNGDSDSPVLVTALSYDTDPVLLKAAAIFGDVNTDDGDEEFYGVNLSGSFQLWDGATIDTGYTFGEGIGSYMVFIDPDVDADGDAIELQAGYLALTQDVGEKWTFRGIYGLRDNDSGGPEATDTLETVHLTAQYDIVENATVGIEYFYGKRETFDGDSFDVDRIQASFQYSF